MELYLAVYMALVVAALLIGRRYAHIILIVACLFLVAFIGTRYYVGCDFVAYELRFRSAGSDLQALDLYGSEVAFDALAVLTKQLGLGYMWLNVFAAVIFMACVYVLLRGTSRPLAALACFFPVLVIQLAMSGVRQASAVGMLMLAVAFFLKGMRIATALTIIVGSFFHTSVIIFLPMAYLAGRKFNISRALIGVVLLAPVAYYFLESRMDVYVDRYVEEIYGEMSAFGAVFRYALLAISAGLFFIYREKVEKRFPDYFPLFMLFAMITLAILPLGLVNTVILHRVIYFVMPVSILMLVYTSIAVSPRNVLTIPRLFPFGMYGAYSVMWFLTSRHASLWYVPYETYLLLD